MISIIFTLIQTILEDIVYSNSFNLTIGIQSFPLNLYCIKLIQENELKVMFTQQSNYISLLAICQINFNEKEKSQTLFEHDNYHDYNCLIYYNAYILGNQIKQIILSHKKVQNLVSLYHIQFSIENNSCIGIIYSKFNSNLILTIDIFGFDYLTVKIKEFVLKASANVYRIIQVLIVMYFHQTYNTTLIFMDYNYLQLQTNDYKLILNSELQYTIICNANSSHLLIASNHNNTIYINEESTFKCKETTERLRNNIIQLFWLYLFQHQFLVQSFYSQQQPIHGKIYYQEQAIIGIQMIAIQFISLVDRISQTKAETICSICFETFKSQSIVRMKYQDRIFHSRSLERLMKNNKVCQLCRSALDTYYLNKEQKFNLQLLKEKVQVQPFLKKLNLLSKHECSLHYIDESLSQNSPVIKQQLITSPNQFILKFFKYINFQSHFQHNSQC
ncbi:unnamed protein product [Paramecium sonneborni]|uniref:Uncharacterized protein n=1 Tax=Paramecium sonneborni TaxID=65129 RepID=A0A8S1KRK5_9CILI|nr:unnamed protein product [Paramecium sonneborni]